MDSQDDAKFELRKQEMLRALSCSPYTGMSEASEFPQPSMISVLKRVVDKFAGDPTYRGHIIDSAIEKMVFSEIRSGSSYDLITLDGLETFFTQVFKNSVDLSILHNASRTKTRLV
jgi:hypothetical protein